MVGLHCCKGFSQFMPSGPYSLVATHGLLMTVVSLVEPWVWGVQASVGTAWELSSSSSWDLERRLSSCGIGVRFSMACGIFPDQGLNPRLLYWATSEDPGFISFEVYICQLFATLWIVASQASLSMGFSWQEYWGGLPFPSPGYFPNPRTETLSPASPALQADSLPTKPHMVGQGSPIIFSGFRASKGLNRFV